VKLAAAALSIYWRTGCGLVVTRIGQYRSCVTTPWRFRASRATWRICSARREGVSGKARSVSTLCSVIFWPVVSDTTNQVLEFFSTRNEADEVVKAWDREEPEQAGDLRVEFEDSPN
jgi:hypothetical protein